MKIKPKNPKYLKSRRIVVAGVAACAVVALLTVRTGGRTAPEEEASQLPEEAVADYSEEDMIIGEIDWEYPEGWIDYTDLIPAEELGDETMQGLSNWRYLLVNGLSQENYLRQNYYPEMVLVESGYYFQTRAADDLRAFLAAAREAGFEVRISRTYMSYIDQRTRFNGLASTLYERGGITLSEAEEEIARQGYFPGADEHQTALAINFTDENGEAKFSTPVLEWMTEHCAEYGFILRYPEGREAYTGRKAEPGHYRYVGQKAAEYIMRKGITLEEFKKAYDNEGSVILPW